MTKKNILIATELTPDSLERLKNSPDLDISVVTPTLNAIRPKLKEAQVLIVRSDVMVDESLLAQAPVLKLIACVSTNLSNVDIEYATKRGILVMNTPGMNAVDVFASERCCRRGRARKPYSVRPAVPGARADANV